MTHDNDNVLPKRIRADENHQRQNSIYPNSLSVLSIVISPDGEQAGNQFCGFTALHVTKQEMFDGLSFSLSGEGGIGLDPALQSGLSELFLQKLRPEHMIVLIGFNETIASLNACARSYPGQGIEAVLVALTDLQHRGDVLDLAELINRPNMTVDDALRLTGNLIPLDRQREIGAWSVESEAGLLTFFCQRNYVVLFLLQALTLPVGEQYAGLLAIWQHMHNSSHKY